MFSGLALRCDTSQVNELICLSEFRVLSLRAKFTPVLLRARNGNSAAPAITFLDAMRKRRRPNMSLEADGTCRRCRRPLSARSLPWRRSTHTQTHVQRPVPICSRGFYTASLRRPFAFPLCSQLCRHQVDISTSDG